MDFLEMERQFIDLEVPLEDKSFLSGAYSIDLLVALDNPANIDLPALPGVKELFELLELYFIHVWPMKAIIHPKKFKVDFENYLKKPVTIPKHLPPFVTCMMAYPISPALVLSMMACAAYYHPLYAGNPDVVRNAFFERARRMLLTDLENMSLTLLKTAIHMNFYSVTNSLWNHAYFWHGITITTARYLKLASFDLKPRYPVDADAAIVDEESRRCFWYVREGDVASSAASKREHFFQIQDEYKHVLLPVSDQVFRNSDPKHYPKTIILTSFLDSPNSFDPNGLGLSSNAFMVVIQSILGRITDFRREASQHGENKFTTDHDDHLNSVFRCILRDLELVFERLPLAVKQLDQGITNGVWSTEVCDWTLVLIVYHSTFTTLYGPEYNMMGLGQDIVKGVGTGREMLKTDDIPEDLKRFLRNSKDLDSILSAWEVSDYFSEALQHAERGTQLMTLMSECNAQANMAGRDTPFIGYCLCQIGLINLIAARQLAMLKMRNPSLDVNGYYSSYTGRGAVVVQMLKSHAKSFSASETGKHLLESVMAEIGGGQTTVDIMRKGMQSQENFVTSQSVADPMVHTVVKEGMSKSIAAALDEPGKCAGTMLQPQGVSARPKLNLS